MSAGTMAKIVSKTAKAQDKPKKPVGRPRIEQYILENNKQAYEFHKNWIIEAMSEDKQA